LAIDFDIGKYRIIFILIPVARYLCRRINKPKHKHKTFSLLPDTLIPYNRISIILMMYILQLLIEKECVEHTLAEIDSITPDEIFFSEKMIQHLLQVMEQARIKLILFFQHHYNTDRGPPDFHISTINEVIDYLLNDQIRFNNEPPCGAYHLSVQYYKTERKYRKNARNFLKANNIAFESQETKPRKAFEALHVNILWTADFMHGPPMSLKGRKSLRPISVQL
jgi:hypothetical protein